jgi:hypothetical protein
VGSQLYALPQDPQRPLIGLPAFLSAYCHEGRRVWTFTQLAVRSGSFALSAAERVSALGPKQTLLAAVIDVGFVPEADIDEVH